jgi:branched-chain amino acid transport system substrate-binding protein
MKMKLNNKILILIFIFISSWSCENIEKNALRRIDALQKNNGDIVIGVAWPFKVRQDFYRQGFEMACDEINAKGLLGRKVKLIFRDDQGVKDNARNIALEFARNENMIAVIGHASSNITLPVSVIYNYSGLLFINTASTNTTLTKHGLELFFRIIPTNAEFARQVANYTSQMGFRKPVVIYARGYYGTDLANLYKRYVSDYGIKVVHRYSYSAGARDWRPIFREMKKLDYDIVFLAGSMPEAAYLIKQSRDWGVNVPYIGSDGFDSNLLVKLGQQAVEGTMYCGLFNPQSKQSKVQQFIENFQKKFHEFPDTEAAKAYDALSLIAFAIEQTKSTNPYLLASYLNFVENWEGITGIHTFDDHGDVQNKSIFFKKIENQKPVVIEHQSMASPVQVQSQPSN